MGLFNFFKKEKPVPFSLTSKDLSHADGMMAYCDTFGFQSGASADLCRFLFSAAEKEAASDGQVMTVFIALNDYQSEVSNSGFCAVVFSASKVIVSRSSGCNVYPVTEINSFRSQPSDNKTVILMEHQGGVCRFGVDPSKAAGILGCCTSALEDFKKNLKDSPSNSDSSFDNDKNFSDFLKNDVISVSLKNLGSSFELSLSSDLTEEENGVDLYKLSLNEILNIKEYYVLDLETTGLNKKSDRIVELAWLHILSGKVVEEYETLVNPEIPISSSASIVNGITDSNVKDSPTYSDIREKVISSLIGSIVVGHNITFDLSFIKTLIGNVEGRILYVDTLSLAKSAFPGLDRYRLDFLCEKLNLSVSSSHRALSDVAATEELFSVCRAELIRKKEEEKQKKKEEKERENQERLEKYGSSPLFNISFVFTGEFQRNRSELEDSLLPVGALLRKSVTSKTDYLVVGDYKNLPVWAYQRKIGKADELISNGINIKKYLRKSLSK